MRRGPGTGGARTQMGAGVATSPHCPGSECTAGEGGACFLRAGSGRGLAAPVGSVSGIAVEANLGSYPWVAFEALLPRGASLSGRFRNIAVSPESLSHRLARRLRLCRTYFGKWVRHRLAPVPRASSSVRPFPRLAASILADLRRSAVVASWSPDPFPAVAPDCEIRSCHPFPSRAKRNLPVDK